MAQPMNCYRQVQDIPDSGWGYIGGEWYVRPPGRVTDSPTRGTDSHGTSTKSIADPPFVG